VNPIGQDDYEYDSVVEFGVSIDDQYVLDSIT
jgi:hypothetical protein